MIREKERKGNIDHQSAWRNSTRLRSFLPSFCFYFFPPKIKPPGANAFFGWNIKRWGDKHHVTLLGKWKTSNRCWQIAINMKIEIFKIRFFETYKIQSIFYAIQKDNPSEKYTIEWSNILTLKFPETYSKTALWRNTKTPT